MSSDSKANAPCGALAEGGPCVLPRGHNRGRVDIPQNHKARPPAPKLDADGVGAALDRVERWLEGYRVLARGGLDGENAHAAWIGGEDQPRVLRVSDVAAVLGALRQVRGEA